VWTIEDARKEANRLQAVIDKGDDPRELEQEKRERKAAEKEAKAAAKKKAEGRKNYTLKALCEAYVAYLKEQGKERSGAAALSAFKCHVFESDAASLPAMEVTAYQIAEIVRNVAEQGKERTAGILRSYLHAAYNAAKKSPFDAKLPSSLIPFTIDNNPVGPITPIPVKAGTRHLSNKELKAYIEHLGDDLTDMALKLALYAGGQRMAQLLRVKVADYDQDAKTIKLLDGKGKRKEPRVHLVPLGPEAAKVADRLLQDATKAESVFLFASRGSKVHGSTPGKRVKEISEEVGGDPFDLRDLRRTVETMLAGLGISKDDRAQLLSHGITGVQATHYDMHEYVKEKRAALRKWERHLKNITTDEPTGKVVPFRGA
jgi:integrase